jgi:hypothetical protein
MLLGFFSPSGTDAIISRLSGLAFNGLTTGLSFKGFIFTSMDADGSGVAVGSFAENDSTTFSAPSSRLRPSSTGGEKEFDGPASVTARSICSAMRSRSRCSSEVVARSFFNDAS